MEDAAEENVFYRYGTAKGDSINIVAVINVTLKIGSTEHRWSSRTDR